MHPIDTVKTRIQSQAFFSASQVPFDHKSIDVTDVSSIANLS